MAYDEGLAQRIHDLLDGEELPAWVDRAPGHVRTLPPT
jgi:hypothetical protein